MAEPNPSPTARDDDKQGDCASFIAEPNQNPTARDDDNQGEGEGEGLFNASRHIHKLWLFEGLPVYKCSGCKEYGAKRGYKCKISSGSKCENFILHEACAELADAIDHPFQSGVPLKFRSETWLTHHCSLCLEKMEGFVFETKRRSTRLHPLCAKLPKILHYSAHENHKLKIVTGRHDNTCSLCNRPIGVGWKYRCEEALCKVYVDLRCAKNDFFGLPEHDIPSTSCCIPKISAGLRNSIVSGTAMFSQAIISEAVSQCFES